MPDWIPLVGVLVVWLITPIRPATFWVMLLIPIGLFYWFLPDSFLWVCIAFWFGFSYGWCSQIQVVVEWDPLRLPKRIRKAFEHRARRIVALGMKADASLKEGIRLPDENYVLPVENYSAFSWRPPTYPQPPAEEREVELANEIRRYLLPKTIEGMERCAEVIENSTPEGMQEFARMMADAQPPFDPARPGRMYAWLIRLQIQHLQRELQQDTSNVE